MTHNTVHVQPWKIQFHSIHNNKRGWQQTKIMERRHIYCANDKKMSEYNWQFLARAIIQLNCFFSLNFSLINRQHNYLPKIILDCVAVESLSTLFLPMLDFRKIKPFLHESITKLSGTKCFPWPSAFFACQGAWGTCRTLSHSRPEDFGRLWIMYRLLAKRVKSQRYQS